MSARLAKCPGCKKAFTLPNFSRPVRAECPRCGTHFTWPSESKTKKSKKKPHGLRGSEDPLLGEEFGGCKVVELLGHGSLGSVYRAEHADEGAVIAIKILPPFLVKRFPHFITRYMAQSRRVADLNHPNVLQVYQVGEHRGFVFTTMKFIDGKSLSECLGKRKTVKPESAVRVARSAAFGLRAMSDSGVLHRNLKPGNILLGRDSKVLVADFGLGPGSSAELKGSVFGTAIMNPEYLSPEQAANNSIDCRSDIYSLGAVLYRMLTGYTPFENLEGAGRRAHLMTPIERNPKVHEDVSKVICRMMEYSPEDRYPTWNEVIDVLDSLFNGTLSELPTQISEEPAPGETTDNGSDTTDTERHEAVQQILSLLPNATPVEPLTEDEGTETPTPVPLHGKTSDFVEDTIQELTQAQTSLPAVLPTGKDTLPPTRSPFYNPDNVETVRRHEESPTVHAEDHAKTIEAVELLARMEQSITPMDTDATVDYGTEPPTEVAEEGELNIDPSFDSELTEQLTHLQKGPQSPGTVDEIDRTVTYVSDADELGFPAPPAPDPLAPPPHSLSPPPTEQALEPLPDEEQPQIQFPFGGNYETPPAEFPLPQSKLEVDAPSRQLTPAAPLTTIQGEPPVQTVPTVRQSDTFSPRQRSGVFKRKRMAREKETVALFTAVITSAIFVLGAVIFWSMRTPAASEKAAHAPVRRTAPKARTSAPRPHKQAVPVDRSAAIKRSVTNRVNQTIAVHKWGEAIRSLEHFARTQTDRSLESWAIQMAQRVQARAQDEFDEITRRAEGAIKDGDQDEARNLYRIVFLHYDLDPYVAQARNKYAALLEAGTETAQPNPIVIRPKKKGPTEPALDTPNFIILDSLVARWRFADALKQCNEYFDASRYTTSPELVSFQKTADLLPGLKYTIIEHLNRSQKKPKIDSLTEPPSTGKIFRATDRSLTIQSGVKVSTLPWGRLHAAGMWQIAMNAISPSNYKMRLAAVLLAVEMDSPEVAAKEVERLKSIGVDVTLYHQRIEHRRSERLKRLGVE